MPDTLDPATILVEILARQGPLSDDDVIERLQAAGVTDPEDVFEHLLDEIGTAASELLDGRWIWLPKLLDGRVFTHRLTASELAHDILTVTPDLDPVTTVCESEEFAHFSDGSSAFVALPMFDLEPLDERGIPLHEVDHLGALLLAPGTLAGLGVAEGDLIGLRLTTEGLAIEAVIEIVDAGVGARLSKMLTTDAPVFFDAAVWTACSDDPALFTQPLAPLSEIADAAGLPYDEDRLAQAGFDFDSWRFNLGCAALTRRYGIEPDEAFALYTLLKFYEQMEFLVENLGDEDTLLDDEPLDDDEPGASAGQSLVELTGELGAVLADPLLAEILLAETVGSGGGPAALGLFAETLEPRVPRPARVACRWLCAVALERIGNIEEAERQLLAAESMDTDWGPVLFGLARFASDRGDAERGLSLLRRAGAAADDSMVVLLERHRAQPRPDLGRNDVCWCGSGRKYKKCHLGREQLPLAERVGWLYSKAAQHITMSGWRDLLVEVGLERTRYADDDTGLDDFVDPLVLDAVLFEGGAFADFLEVRGSLLPDDERALAEQWLLVERSVFDIEDVHRGHSITVRDIRTGDRHEVRERTGSAALKPGQLICTRAVPAGDTMQFFGGIEPVALHERDSLIALLDTEPDAVELVAHLSRRFAPPTLVNTEGDLLAVCQATVQVGDPGRIESVLDDTYDRLDGEEPARWLEHVTTQGMPRIRATLVLEGDTLRVETNSDQRMDRVLATLARVDPAMTVLDDVRQPMPDARVAAELASQTPGGGGALDPADPEVAAFLEQMILDYETTWLDEKIPALDGSTPRQAADDPTRRTDLIKLLDTFPAGPAAAGGMDGDRLRAALGLE
ncbi:SEC-C metal-binding domain-containing protein [soil metagenome]